MPTPAELPAGATHLHQPRGTAGLIGYRLPTPVQVCATARVGAYSDSKPADLPTIRDHV